MCTIIKRVLGCLNSCCRQHRSRHVSEALFWGLAAGRSVCVSHKSVLNFCQDGELANMLHCNFLNEVLMNSLPVVMTPTGLKIWNEQTPVSSKIGSGLCAEFDGMSFPNWNITIKINTVANRLFAMISNK